MTPRKRNLAARSARPLAVRAKPDSPDRVALNRRMTDDAGAPGKAGRRRRARRKQRRRAREAVLE